MQLMSTTDELSETIKKIKKYRFEEEFLAIANEQYNLLAPNTTLYDFISSTFSVCKSSSAGVIVLSIAKVLETLQYQDLIKSFEIIKNDELAVYYFSRFLVEDLNINPYEMMERNAELKDAFGFVHRALPIAKIQINEDQEIEEVIKTLMNRLKSQGAPMLDD